MIKEFRLLQNLFYFLSLTLKFIYFVVCSQRGNFLIRETFAFLRFFFIIFYIILFVYFFLFLLQVNIEIKYRKYRLLQVLKMLFIVLLLFNLHHLKIEIYL